MYVARQWPRLGASAVINEKTKFSVGSGRLSLMIWIGTVTRLTPAGIVTVPVPPTKSCPIGRGVAGDAVGHRDSAGQRAAAAYGLKTVPAVSLTLSSVFVMKTEFTISTPAVKRACANWRARCRFPCGGSIYRAIGVVRRKRSSPRDARPKASSCARVWVREWPSLRGPLWDLSGAGG